LRKKKESKCDDTCEGDWHGGSRCARLQHGWATAAAGATGRWSHAGSSRGNICGGGCYGGGRWRAGDVVERGIGAEGWQFAKRAGRPGDYCDHRRTGRGGWRDLWFYAEG